MKLTFTDHVHEHLSLVIRTLHGSQLLVKHHDLPLEPTAPPAAIEVTKKTSQSISLKWNAVPDDHKNGIITGYRVIYQALPNGTSFNVTVNVGGEGEQETMSAKLDELNEFTNYSIRVLGFTAKGDGPPTAVKIVQTEEDSK